MSDTPPAEPKFTPRDPFGPPFYAEDVPQLDNMHWHLNLRTFEAWLVSDERATLLKHPRPRDIRFWYCAYPECDKSIKKGRWSQIKADDWFFTMDNTKAFCKNHHPSWVSQWRDKKKNQPQRYRSGKG